MHKQVIQLGCELRCSPFALAAYYLSYQGNEESITSAFANEQAAGSLFAHLTRKRVVPGMIETGRVECHRTR